MTAADYQSFRQATHCYICGNALKTDKVRDHCHINW